MEVHPAASDRWKSPRTALEVELAEDEVAGNVALLRMEVLFPQQVELVLRHLP